MRDFLELIGFILCILLIGAFVTAMPSCSETLRDHGIKGVVEKIACGKVDCLSKKE